MSKKILALLMALMLVFSVIPVGAMAEDEASIVIEEIQTADVEASAPQETVEVTEALAVQIAETPVEEIHTDETPVEEAPVEEAPEEEISTEETPSEEIPAEEAPVEEIPAEETPAEEAPIEEITAEEAPVEEVTEEELVEQVAETPVFVLDLSDAPITYAVGDEAEPLEVAAVVQDGGTVRYQWYYSLEDENGLPEEERTAIPDATDAIYVPETRIPGVGYYFAEAMNELEHAEPTSATSKLVRIEIVDAESVETIQTLALGALPLSDANEPEKVRVIVENTTYSKEDGAPWDGRLVDEWVTLESDSTMMGCVVKALSAKGYSQTGAESNYIEEINGLNAFDGGFESGWMGTLNDWFTNEGFGAFTVENGTLQNGDTIRIMYTCNGYGEDLGGSWSNNDKTVKSIDFSAGTLEPAFDKDTHDYILYVDRDVNSVIVTPEASNKNFQVRSYVKDSEYKHTDAIPVEDGTIITVKCGDPTWPTMNWGSESVSAEEYRIAVALMPEAMPLLRSLIVHTGTSPNATSVLLRNPDDVYNTDVVFDPHTFEYTLAAQIDTVTQLRFRAAAEDENAVVTVKWADQEKDITWKSGSSKFANCIAGGKNMLELVVSLDEKSTTYVLNVDVQPTITALKLMAGAQELQLDKAFSATTYAYTVTVPAGAAAISVEATPRKDNYTFLYDGVEAAQIDLSDPEKTGFTIAAICGEVTNEYTFDIKRAATGDVAFAILPGEAADAIVTVLDNKGNPLAPNADGSYSGMFSEYEHTYTVAKYGYITQKGIVPAEGGTISIALLPNGGTLEEVESEWNSFRGNDTNMGITDVQTPIDPDSTALLWNKKLGTGWTAAPSVQIIVDDALVVMSGKKIYKLDLNNGDILAEGDMDNSPSYGYTPPIYADGMIFCPLGSGTIQAFNAKTLESVWIYHDPLKGQALSPITYSDGYIYTGFWNSETKEANYVCLSVSDDEPENKQAEKLSTWDWKQAGGFYWAGSVAVGNALIVGTDDGTSGAEGDSKLYSFNKKTGAVIDSITLTGLGDQRSTIAYDKAAGRGYFTTKNGYLCSVRIDSETGKLSDLKSVKNVEGAQSTSTPVVYDGKVYYGVGGGFGASPLNNFVAADAQTLQMDYAINLKGYPQCSMLLTTGYEEDGYLYFYSTYNTTPGGISMIKVKKGSNSVEDAELIELYDAKGFEQYCITSMICDKNGTLYYKNDSANVFAIGTPKYGNVIRLIKAIGEVTQNSVQPIAIARNAYNALDEENQALVTNYQMLLDAEASLKALVEAAIDEIGEVTIESEDKILATEQLYNSLSEDMKNAIENVQKLIEAKGALSKLKIAEAQRLIDAIPENITLANKAAAQQAVTAAKAYLEQLTEAERAEVRNADRIAKAQKTIDKLVAGGSTKSVRVGVTTGYKTSGATNKVVAQIKALLDAQLDFAALTDAQEKQIIDAELAYRALSDDEKLFVTNYDDFKVLLERFGERNHIDVETGIRLKDIDWNIRIVVRELEIHPDMAKTMRAVLGGKGEMVRLMHIELINLLTGDVQQPEKLFTLLLPADTFDPERTPMIACFDAEGQMNIIAPTLVEIDPVTGAELPPVNDTREIELEPIPQEATEEISAEEAEMYKPMKYLKFRAEKAQCRYAIVALDIAWEQLPEHIDFNALPESWNEWPEIPAIEVK